MSRIETWYAGRQLSSREAVPEGALARRAVADLILGKRLFPKAWEATKERLAAATLFSRVRAAGLVPPGIDAGREDRWSDGRIPTPEEWVHGRIEELGLESGRDLALLSPQDVLAPDLPAPARRWLDETLPRTVNPGDAVYEVEYDAGSRTATLTKVSGNRREAPSLTFLPPLRGFQIRVRHGNRQWQLR